MFDTILEKLGFGKHSTTSTPPPAAATTTPPPRVAAEAAAPPGAAVPPAAATAAATTAAAAGAAPAARAAGRVDVLGKLERLAAESSQKLNWRTSIVDLLKLLDIDSSFGARKELAIELGCPPDKMSDSAQMNMWLHTAVLRKLAENGGNVPSDLLD
jgi:hypothetical protein